MSRDPQLRSARVLCFRLASFCPLVGSVAEELKDCKVVERSTCRRGPAGVDFVHVTRTFNEWFSVELWLLPAHGSRAGMRAACVVDLKLVGGSARAWRVMPSIPSWDPLV